MIIGIGGVSNSGKSTLAKYIKDIYPTYKIRILCQDDFVKPHYELPKIFEHIDWETPDSIDFTFYKNQLISAKKNVDIVIAEGLFAFSNNMITELYDKKIFLSISKKSFLNRKKHDIRWGEEPDWYIHHIWQSYLLYGRIKPDIKDVLYLSGEIPFPEKIIKKFLFP